jgi:hypothetical protein
VLPVLPVLPDFSLKRLSVGTGRLL